VRIATIEIDREKAVFQVHGVDEQGEVLLCKQLQGKSRDPLRIFNCA